MSASSYQSRNLPRTRRHAMMRIWRAAERENLKMKESPFSSRCGFAAISAMHRGPETRHGRNVTSNLMGLLKLLPSHCDCPGAPGRAAPPAGSLAEYHQPDLPRQSFLGAVTVAAVIRPSPSHWQHRRAAAPSESDLDVTMPVTVGVAAAACQCEDNPEIAVGPGLGSRASVGLALSHHHESRPRSAWQKRLLAGLSAQSEFPAAAAPDRCTATRTGMTAARSRDSYMPAPVPRGLPGPGERHSLAPRST